MPLKRAARTLLPAPAVTALRTVRLSVAKARSGLLAAIPSELDAQGSHHGGLQVPNFLIGSGRSGTTALGKALGLAPDVCYLFEPVDRWYSVLPETDYVGIFDASRARCTLGADAVDDAVRRRFRRVFRSALSGDRRFLEKTPINALRIGFLEAIDPRSRYIEIRRDGTEVVRSIVDRSRRNDYRLWGRRLSNNWWGASDCKWRALSNELAGIPDLAIEPELLAPDADFFTRAAIEWIASIEAVERAATELGARLHRVTYGELTTRPEETLAGIAAFLGVREGPWLRDAAESLRRGEPARREPVLLPPTLAQRLNIWNERLGFSGRAIERTTGTTDAATR